MTYGFNNECRMCHTWKNNQTKYNDIIIDNDSIILETDNFFVVPDLLPITLGHLLIVSKKHFKSSAYITEELHDEFRMLCLSIFHRMNSYYKKKCVLFEHNSLESHSIKLNSVNHLHFHVVLYNHDLLALIKDNVKCEVIELSTSNDIVKYKNNDYIFVIDNAKKVSCVLIDKEDISSQLIRKLIFEKSIECNVHNHANYNWKEKIDQDWYTYSKRSLQFCFNT